MSKPDSDAEKAVDTKQTEVPKKDNAEASKQSASAVIKCPKCGCVETFILNELMKDNRVVRQRKCKKCEKVFSA